MRHWHAINRFKPQMFMVCSHFPNRYFFPIQPFPLGRFATFV